MKVTALTNRYIASGACSQVFSQRESDGVVELLQQHPALLTRLPTTRLAVAPSEIPWRADGALTFGPAHLPVTW